MVTYFALGLINVAGLVLALVTDEQSDSYLNLYELSE